MDKTIAELIHDRVFAEGGTLNVWLNGAKFRKMTSPLKARSVHTNTEEEKMDRIEEFVPSPELSTMMRRNIVELRKYIEDDVKAWREEVQNRRVLPEGSTPPRPARDGRLGRDCHEVEGSGISGNAAKVVCGAAVCVLAFAGYARGSHEISALVFGGECDRSFRTDVWREPSRINVGCQGGGERCSTTTCVRW